MKRWNVRVLRIEKVAYQAALKDVLDREARTRGISLFVDLVPPEGEKVRRANAWSALVEDGTVLFGPTQQDLIDSMLAVPQDSTKWDLVDDAGLCIGGLPALPAACQRLAGTERTTPDLAESYAAPMAARRQEPRQEFRPFRPRIQDGLERAKGYAGRRPGAPQPRRRTA